MNQSLANYQYKHEETAGLINRAIQALTPQRFKKFENKVKNNLKDVKEPVIDRSITKLEKTIKSTVKNKKSATITAKLNEDHGEQVFKDAAKELKEVYFTKGKLDKELLNSDLRQYEKSGKIYRLDYKPEYKKMVDQLRKKLGNKKFNNFQKALAESAHSEQEAEKLIRTYIKDDKQVQARRLTIIESVLGIAVGIFATGAVVTNPEAVIAFFVAVWAYKYILLFGIAIIVGGLAIVAVITVVYKNLAKVFDILAKILLNRYLAYATTIVGAIYLIVKIAANWAAIWGSANSLATVLLTVNSITLIWIIGGASLALLIVALIYGAVKKAINKPYKIMDISSISTYEDLIPSNPKVKLVNY